VGEKSKVILSANQPQPNISSLVTEINAGAGGVDVAPSVLIASHPLFCSIVPPRYASWSECLLAVAGKMQDIRRRPMEWWGHLLGERLTVAQVLLPGMRI